MSAGGTDAVPVPVEDVDTDELIRRAAEAVFAPHDSGPRCLILSSRVVEVTSQGVHHGEIEAR